MTYSEMKRLNRAELLELLSKQGQEIDDLKQQVVDANNKISNMKVLTEDSGSISDTVKIVMGMFEAAEKVADVV
jgi:hypothetical protein